MIVSGQMMIELSRLVRLVLTVLARVDVPVNKSSLRINPRSINTASHLSAYR